MPETTYLMSLVHKIYWSKNLRRDLYSACVKLALLALPTGRFEFHSDS